MIINSTHLINRSRSPIKNMIESKERLHGVSHGLGEAGYDIRLKQHITFGKTSRTERIVLVDDEMPQPGRFVIASAIEEFDMPTDLVGIVHDKSTWARRGLSVFNTVIEPGWKGFLTLELVYHGEGILAIPAGAGIAQVVFHQTSCHVAYDGKYQHQADRPVEALYEKG